MENATFERGKRHAWAFPRETLKRAVFNLCVLNWAFLGLCCIFLFCQIFAVQFSLFDLLGRLQEFRVSLCQEQEVLLLLFCSISSTSLAQDKVILQLAFSATDNMYNMQLLSSKISAICEPCCLQFVSGVSLFRVFSNLWAPGCFYRHR